MRKLFAVVLLAGAVAFCGAGCATKGSKIETGGAYAAAGQQADLPLLLADQLYKTCYTSLDLAFTFERTNRSALWALNPNIKREMDKLRNSAWEVNVEWAKARQVYLQNPVPDNLTALQTILANAQRLVPLAQQILASFQGGTFQ